MPRILLWTNLYTQEIRWNSLDASFFSMRTSEIYLIEFFYWSFWTAEISTSSNSHHFPSIIFNLSGLLLWFFFVFPRSFPLPQFLYCIGISRGFLEQAFTYWDILHVPAKTFHADTLSRLDTDWDILTPCQGYTNLHTLLFQIDHTT